MTAIALPKPNHAELIARNRWLLVIGGVVLAACWLGVSADDPQTAEALLRAREAEHLSACLDATNLADLRTETAGYAVDAETLAGALLDGTQSDQRFTHIDPVRLEEVAELHQRLRDSVAQHHQLLDAELDLSDARVACADHDAEVRDILEHLVRTVPVRPL